MHPENRPKPQESRLNEVMRKAYENNALLSLRQAYLAEHEDARETFIADALRYIGLAEEYQE